MALPKIHFRLHTVETDLISESSFFLTSCLTKVKEPRLEEE